MNLNTIDLSRLDMLRPILPFPLLHKVAALAGGFVVLFGVYVYFAWLPLNEDIQQVETNVEGQRQLLEKNSRLAANLPRKRAEYAQLKKQLTVALKILPDKSQIPDLLEGVSRAGMDSGLAFSVFRPADEKPRQFVAEVPVEVEITGTYRQLMTFLKRVGEMPRIVDVKNLKLSQLRGGGKGEKGKSIGSDGTSQLSISGLAVTYRFVEGAKGMPKAKAKRRSRRRR